MTKEENEQRLAYLKNIVLNLPHKPGTYQYYDKKREPEQKRPTRAILYM